MAYFSEHQKRALELCISEYGPCPFGCAKDGAPNCQANVTGYLNRQCEPGKKTVALLTLAEGSQQ